MPDVGNLPGWLALVVAGVGAWVSLRKVRVDERGGVVGELQELVETLKKEIDRINERSKAREAEIREELDTVKRQLVTSRIECEKQIAALQLQLDEQIQTTLRQARNITELERRRTSQDMETERRKPREGT